MLIRRQLLVLALAAGLATASGPIPAAMEPDPVDALAERIPEFAQGRRAVEAKDWNSAIKWLAAAEKRAPANADLHNYLGYAYRNAGQLDLAFKHYERALQIDPRHLGAHEYIGEAYLMANNVAKAEEHLTALKRHCASACEQRDDLSRKIDAYRARRK